MTAEQMLSNCPHFEMKNRARLMRFSAFPIGCLTSRFLELPALLARCRHQRETTVVKRMWCLARLALAAASLVFGSAAVHAQSHNLYSFGQQLSHPNSTPYQPCCTFATLSVATSDYLHYVFDLQATSDLGSIFSNPNARVGGVVFNTDPDAPTVSSVALLPGSWGVNGIMYLPYSMSLGGVAFDFTEALFGNGGLQSGERVAWSTTFEQPTGFATPAFALKVFGIGSDDNAYAFYSPTSVSPIPEPKVYGLLVAGLFVIGFALRRRRIGSGSGLNGTPVPA